MASDGLHFYEIVSDELKRNDIDDVLWTKAFADAGGVESATKAGLHPVAR